MKLEDILAKIAKGETFTDEEKKFAGEFNLQTHLDAAAGNARKKAETAEKAARDALAKLQEEFDAFKTENDPGKKLDDIAKLTARIGKLEAAKQAAEAQTAKLQRDARVRELAKAAGINPAKGVDSKSLDLLVDNLMCGVDLDDADAVKTAFDGFKTANAGLIAANTVGGAGAKGEPGAGAFGGKNPFAKDTFNLTAQLEIQATNPQLAAQLKAEANQ